MFFAVPPGRQSLARGSSRKLRHRLDGFDSPGGFSSRLQMLGRAFIYAETARPIFVARGWDISKSSGNRLVPCRRLIEVMVALCAILRPELRGVPLGDVAGGFCVWSENEFR